ncbi:helix-turn-helix domain-containing protein [Candidatus Enterovibrio escicola]|uniref:helix-turn-helix domain-containing protein n=1 Tax=Candidatus Enterovibrio escicola TaxID=1927127 RepID=UPI000BE22CDD
MLWRCIWLHKQLNDNDRFYIEKRLAVGGSFNQITRILGYVHFTISREINRNIQNNFHGVDCHHLASEQAKETHFATSNGLAFGCVSFHLGISFQKLYLVGLKACTISNLWDLDGNVDEPSV